MKSAAGGGETRRELLVSLLSIALPNYLHAPVIYYALIIGCLIVLGVFL